MAREAILTPSEPVDDRAEVGILLVHGIGDQQPGDTLLTMGAPLIDWLSDWLDGMNKFWIRRGVKKQTLMEWIREIGCPEGGQSGEDLARAYRAIQEQEPPELELVAHERMPMSHECLERWEMMLHVARNANRSSGVTPVGASQIPEIAEKNQFPWLVARARVTEATVKPPGDVPAHSLLRIETMDTAGTIRRENWLLAEAHWAQCFAPSRAGRVGLWSAYVCPYLIGSLYTGQFAAAREALAGKRPEMPRALGLARIIGLACLFPALPILIVLAQSALVVLAALSMFPLQIVRRGARAFQFTLSAVVGDSYLFLESRLERAAIVGRVRERLEWLASRCRNLVIVAHSQGAYVALETLQVSLPRQLRLLVTLGSGIQRLGTLRQIRTTEGSKLRFCCAGAWFGGLLAYFAVQAIWVGAPDPLRFARMFAGVAVASIVILAVSHEMVPDLHGGWHTLLRQRGIRWLDYFTADDPVPGGSRSIWPAARQRITNFGSALFDHTTYWANQDQFIPSVLNAITRACDSQIRIDRLSKRDGLLLEAAARWRPHRIAWLRVGCWLATLGCLGVWFRLRGDFTPWGRAVREGLAWVAAAVQTSRFDAILKMAPDRIGLWLAVVSWGAVCLALGITWHLWERRDARVLMSRFGIGGGVYGLIYNFFALCYIALLATILAAAGCVAASAGIAAWLMSAALLAAILVAVLIRDEAGVLDAAVQRRKRTLITLPEAAALTGTTEYEVPDRCPIVNRPFDATAYDDCMYDERGLVDKADVVRLKAEIDARHQSLTAIHS